MPWCDECAKFWSPPSLHDGHCPACDTDLAPVRAGAGGDVPRTPWHFKLLVVALILYLGFRAYQGVFWVIHHV